MPLSSLKAFYWKNIISSALSSSGKVYFEWRDGKWILFCIWVIDFLVYKPVSFVISCRLAIISQDEFGHKRSGLGENAPALVQNSTSQ